MLLQCGQLLEDGPVEPVIRRYHEETQGATLDAQTALSNERHRRGNGAVRFYGIRVEDEAGRERFDFRMGETIRFILSYRVIRPVPLLEAVVVLRSGLSGEIVTSSRHPVFANAATPPREGVVTVEWPTANLRPGEYPLYLWLGDQGLKAYDVVDSLIGPLRISAEGSMEDLGFDPSSHCGYFGITSRTIPNSLLAAGRELAENQKLA